MHRKTYPSFMLKKSDSIRGEIIQQKKMHVTNLALEHCEPPAIAVGEARAPEHPLKVLSLDREGRGKRGGVLGGKKTRGGWMGCSICGCQREGPILKLFPGRVPSSTRSGCPAASSQWFAFDYFLGWKWVGWILEGCVLHPKVHNHLPLRSSYRDVTITTADKGGGRNNSTQLNT